MFASILKNLAPVYALILKFNQNHDPKNGQFISGASNGTTEIAGLATSTDRSGARSHQGSATGTEIGTVSLRQQQPDALPAQLVTHYGQTENLASLSAKKYGTGIAGAEAYRLSQSDDLAIKNRVYFYLTQPDQLPAKEPGLGSHIYQVKLANLYDIQNDPKGLIAKVRDIQDPNDRSNALESSIVKAGYDGYAVKAYNMAVVLGKDVPVQYRGTDIKKQAWATLLKFNPHHDPKNGQFTSGSLADGLQGEVFVSPNREEHLDFQQAVGKLDSDEQHNLIAVSKKIDAGLGIKARTQSGLGAWADGAENSIVQTITNTVDWDTLRVSAAMKGLLAEQKAVLPFQVDADGKDRLYNVTVASTDLEAVHKDLIKLGLEFHTLVPEGKSIKVIAFDQGAQLGAVMEKIGEHYDTEIQQWRGHGEFLGSWDSREEGRKIYESAIENYQQNQGHDKLRFWQRLRANWGQIEKEEISFSGILKFNKNHNPANGRFISGKDATRLAQHNKEIVEESVSHETYHGTSSAAIKQILTEGIKPVAQEYKVWGKRYMRGDRANSVYLTTDEDLASSYADSAIQKLRKDILKQYPDTPYGFLKPEQRKHPGVIAMEQVTPYIVTVKVPDSAKEQLVADEKELLAVRIKGSIPASWITGVKKMVMHAGAVGDEDSDYYTYKPVKIKDILKKAVGTTYYVVIEPTPVKKRDWSAILKLNQYHDDLGRFTSRGHAVQPGHRATPTVTAMQQAIDKVGQKAVEDAVTAHMEAIGGDKLSPEDFAHEIERVVRQLIAKKADWATILKFNKNHDPKNGQFSSGKNGIVGLPDDVSLADPSLSSIHEALQRGAFTITAKEVDTGYGEPKYNLTVIPNDIPAGWQTTKRGQIYDPQYFKESEWGRVEAKDAAIYQGPEGSEDGYIFRGMSYEEYQAAKKDGYFQSKGDYNLGDEQVGLTYFSTDKGQAVTYASGFAPWQYKPTITRPAIVVKVADPGNHKQVAGTGETEVGVQGKIPFDSVKEVYYGHPIAVDPGDMDIVHDAYSGKNTYKMGSYSAMSVSLRWDTTERDKKMEWGKLLKGKAAQLGYAFILKGGFKASQPRDKNGRWTAGGGSGASGASKNPETVAQHLFDSAAKDLPRDTAQPVSTPDALFKESAIALDQMKTWLDVGRGVAAQLGYTTMTKSIDDAIRDGDLAKPGGMLFMAPLKRRERSTEKVNADYAGDWSKLLDVARATIAVDKLEDVKTVIDKLTASGMVLARQPKNRFAKPTDEGYRDTLLNVKLPNGIIGELQVHVKPMLIAKDKGHKFYNTIRDLYRDYGKGIEAWPDSAKKTLTDATAASKKLYNDAWQAAV